MPPLAPCRTCSLARGWGRMSVGPVSRQAGRTLPLGRGGVGLVGSGTDFRVGWFLLTFMQG